LLENIAVVLRYGFGFGAIGDVFPERSENRVDAVRLQGWNRGERVLHGLAGHEARDAPLHKPVPRRAFPQPRALREM
jgi:hypothetical protein